MAVDLSATNLSGGVQARNGRRRLFKLARLAPYLFAAPFMVAFVLFVIAPLGYALYLSLFRTAMIGGQRFVFLENYQKAFVDQSFWRGLLNALQFGLYMTPVMLILALGAALLIDSKVVRGGGLFRLIIFIPYTVPGVIGTLLWGYLYGQNYGLIGQTLRGVGVSEPPNLLGPDWILQSLANVSVWQYLGYNFVILYAALQAVPRDLWEAAYVDGAKPRQVARFIKIPMIWPAIVIVLLFAIIGTIQLFNEPFLLKPVASVVVTDDFTPNIYTYSLAFRTQQYNYAGAVSFVMGLITAILAFGFLKVANRGRK
jgi:multiple sugar transport system permease protein